MLRNGSPDSSRERGPCAPTTGFRRLPPGDRDARHESGTEDISQTRGVAALSDREFKATMGPAMSPVVEETPLPAGFWEYFEALGPESLEGFDFSTGSISHAYRNPSGRFDHVLITSTEPDVVLAIVVDRIRKEVHGHRVLDLPRHYGLR